MSSGRQRCTTHCVSRMHSPPGEIAAHARTRRAAMRRFTECLLVAQGPRDVTTRGLSKFSRRSEADAFARELMRSCDDAVRAYASAACINLHGHHTSRERLCASARCYLHVWPLWARCRRPAHVNRDAFEQEKPAGYRRCRGVTDAEELLNAGAARQAGISGRQSMAAARSTQPSGLTRCPIRSANSPATAPAQAPSRSSVPSCSMDAMVAASIRLQ
jgi:hypothetical protein